MNIRHFLLLFAAFFSMSVWLSSAAQAASPQEAGQYIENLGNQALRVIQDTSLSKPQKQSKLESIFSDNVDVPWVGRFVLGRFWRQANEEQRTRYLKEYEKFLVLHYTERFTEYTSGTFKVTDSKQDADNEYTVGMQIQSDSKSEPVMVDYRIRLEPDGRYKIFDVVVEGVSLITTQRSEFSSVITNHDIEFLISQLASRSIRVE